MSLELLPDVLWVLAELGCGIACAHIARSKGRSGFWWFIAGVTFSVFGVVFASLASDLKKEAAREGELRSLRRELSNLRFNQAVTLGPNGTTTICGGCVHFNPGTSICRAFAREVHEAVATCREHEPRRTDAALE